MKFRSCGDLPTTCNFAKLDAALTGLVFRCELLYCSFDRPAFFIQNLRQQFHGDGFVRNKDYRLDHGDKVSCASSGLLSHFGALFTHVVLGSTFLRMMSPNVFFCTSLTLSVRTISNTAIKAVTSSRCECISSKNASRLKSETSAIRFFRLPIISAR